MGPLEPQQQRQLKQVIAEFANIFAKNNNDLGKTDIIQRMLNNGLIQPSRSLWASPVVLSFSLVKTVNTHVYQPCVEAYQVFWANKDHNKLSPILFWDDNNKGKQEEELTWNINQVWETDNNQNKSANWEWKKIDKGKKKEKEKETIPTNSTYSSYAYTSLQPPNYH
ncbi:hypothetical protein G9A89_023943 [Geosiphon pyriformis]|nr:hypothetical protein G9A89_023943 [Geosiphon pyriformis]